ncbi:MAG: T9SS type A sorting domain-containing protein [Chitinophagales bacterium]
MKYFSAAFFALFFLSAAQAQYQQDDWKFIPPGIPVSLSSQFAPFKPESENITYPGSSDRTNIFHSFIQPKQSDLRGFTSVEIGNTYFDLQTNASVCHSLFRDELSGKMNAVWNFAPTIDPDFTSRGTGYNYFNGNFWQPNPTSRIEDVRTGWPNVVVTSDNAHEYVLCHNLQFGLVQINSRPVPGEGSWIEELGNLQAPNTFGVWWPRIIRGGSPYLHAIALTLPTLQGGIKYQGIDGALLYYRSSDNGATWDKQKIVIEGLDSLSYARIRPDNYAIDAYQNNVAIVVGGFGNDLALFFSPSSGLTWEKTTIQKFPIARFYDQVSDVNGDSIPDLVETNDGSLSVLIDKSGTIHVWAGYNQIYNDDSTDNQFSFEPTSNGILYWNSNLDTLPMQLITGALDLNYNGVLDATGYGFFNSGFATHPSSGLDDLGNLYFTYSALYENGIDKDQKNVRHTYLMGTSNSGVTWSYPYDIANDPNSECIYACIARENDANLHLIYQKDFCAGVGATYNDPDPCNNGELSTIVYIEVSGNEVLNNTLVDEVAAEKDGIIFPNPSSGEIELNLPIDHPGKGTINVCDLKGKIVFETSEIISPSQKLKLSFLPQGFYIAHIASDDFNFTTKFNIVR